MAINNRRARYDYELLETIEAGIILNGPEVKSLDAGQASLNEAHCIIKNGKVILIGCHINSYKPAGEENGDPTRSRVLLLKKIEIERLSGKIKERGLTVVPVKIYRSESGFFKIEIALARGKKNYDKKRALKERDIARDTRKGRW